MYSTKTRGGKAFAAEQKIRELKKLLLISKRIKQSNKKRINSSELIKKATFNLNNKVSPKYGLSPQQIESKSFDKNEGKYFQQVYDISRLWNVGIAKARNERYDEKIDQRKNIKLRSPLQVGEKVFVLSSRLKKKDPAGQLYKSTTENRPFFDRNRISTIKNCTNINGINYYWITENDRTIKGRFLREELFALKNQFL